MPIQEEVEIRTMTMIISATKLTATVLKDAMIKVLAQLKKQSAKSTQKSEDVIPHGRQTVKELIGQNAGVSNVELDDKKLGGFNRIARKYGVDYAIKKVKSEQGTKFYVFFKSRDADAISSVLKEYTAKAVKKNSRKSVIQQLHKQQSKVQTASHDRVRTKHRERER